MPDSSTSLKQTASQPAGGALRFYPERCTGCLRCELACSYEQVGAYQPSRSVIRVEPLEKHSSYVPYACPQCDEAWCMTACPVDAIDISAAGAKVVADNRCVGCKLCTIACPYGTIFLDADSKKAVKCDLCGGQPACVSACPTDAISYDAQPAADWLGAFAAQRLKGLAAASSD